MLCFACLMLITKISFIVADNIKTPYIIITTHTSQLHHILFIYLIINLLQIAFYISKLFFITRHWLFFNINYIAIAGLFFVFHAIVCTKTKFFCMIAIFYLKTAKNRFK